MKWLRKREEGGKAGSQVGTKCFLNFGFYPSQWKPVILKGQTLKSLWNTLNHSGGCFDVSSFTEVLFAGRIDKMLTPRQLNVYCAAIRTSAATRTLFKTGIFNLWPGIGAFLSPGFQNHFTLMPPSFWTLHTVDTIGCCAHMVFSKSATVLYKVVPIIAGRIITTATLQCLFGALKHLWKPKTRLNRKRKNSLFYWSCIIKIPDDKHQLADWYDRSVARSRRLFWQTSTRATGKYTQDNNLRLSLSSFIATYSTSAFLPSLPVCHHIPPSPPCVLSWQRLGRLIIMPACL